MLSFLVIACDAEERNFLDGENLLDKDKKTPPIHTLTTPNQSIIKRAEKIQSVNLFHLKSFLRVYKRV
jgi:hypothetical protein